MDKYCEFLHLLLRPSVVLVLDVEVECKRGGVLLLAPIEATLVFLIKLIFLPSDEFSPARAHLRPTLTLKRTEPHLLHLTFQLLVLLHQNGVFFLQVSKGRFKIDLPL